MARKPVFHISMTTPWVFLDTSIFPFTPGPIPTLSRKPGRNRTKIEEKLKIPTSEFYIRDDLARAHGALIRQIAVHISKRLGFRIQISNWWDSSFKLCFPVPYHCHTKRTIRSSFLCNYNDKGLDSRLLKTLFVAHKGSSINLYVFFYLHKKQIQTDPPTHPLICITSRK